MTLPTDPQNTSPNNADDPFGGMDMMAWMESLAKRQGASSDELTTAANIDVPLPPPDAVVTGPGYTPGYDIPKSKTPASAPTDTRPVQAVPVAPPPPPTPPPPAPVQATPNPAAAADPNDPFGGMDMMAWMESLAKRQGASSDELTTAANMDIPLPPADTVIDEPGYTPGYDTSTSAKSSAAKADKPVAAPPPAVVPAAPPVIAPPPAPIPAPAPVQAAPTPAAAAVDPNDPFGGMDMMAWMESLAKRQGASSDELTTAANMDIPLPPADTVIDEPGYTPGYDTSTSAKSTAKPAAASVPPTVTPAAPIPPPVVAAAPPAPVAVTPPAPPPPAEPVSDPFAAADQMADPMAWLETLARRQGANPEELMTSADMNIPEPPANTVVDEPGYSDYSPFGGPAPVSEAMDTPSMSSIEAAALLGLSDHVAEPNPLNTMDPLAWLESLAAPQATGNNDFTSFTTPSSETSEAMEAASALSWLEQLAREAQGYPYEQTETPSGSIITPAALEAQPEVDISETWVDTTPARADELGGLSDDMTQLQQWLAAQASSLSEVHDLAEDPAAATIFDQGASDFGDSASTEAVPGDIPDWLREHMPGATAAAPSLATPAPLSEIFDEPAIPADLPSWLLENVSAGTSAADPFGFGANTTDAEPASDLSAEAASNIVSEYDFVAADEPAALDQVSYGDAAEVEDPWVEAFEYEESRRLAGDENELPDWYTEALTRSGEMSVGALAETTSEVVQPEPQPDVLTAGDYPTWLSGLMSEDENNEPLAAQDQPRGALDFADMSADQPIMAGDLPSWLTESIPDSSVSMGLSFDSNQFDTGSDDIEMADLPDWLRASVPKDEPKPVPPAAVAPAPTPAPQPVPAAPPPMPTPAPIPAPVSIAPPKPAPPVQPPPPVPTPAAADVRDFWGAAQSIADSMSSLKADIPVAPPLPPAPTPVAVPQAPVSVDHGQRLQRARDLVAQGQYRESLTHYQSLIDSEAALDHVIGDMQTIVQAQPKDPSARRLLGDAHLRKGNLQDALDTYRQALDQL